MRPSQQTLRYGAFPGQAPQNRNPPMASGRLQDTTKIGNGTNWGFGAANGAMPTAQPRQTGPGATSFAQTIGGSQPAAPLDLSEFPSLSGTSQPQYQNPSQAIWATQRAVQHTPVQRPLQQQHPINPQAPQQHQQMQDHPQRPNDDVFSPSSHLQGPMDGHRYSNVGGPGQANPARQPPSTSADEFPPLGRNGTDDDERRGSVLQNAGFGSFSNTNAFSLPQEQLQNRNPMASASSSQANNTRSSSVVDRLSSANGTGFGSLSTGRSPVEANRQGHAGIQDHDRNIAPTSQGPQQGENSLNSLLTNLDSQYHNQQPNGQSRQQAAQSPQDYGNQIANVHRSIHTPEHSLVPQTTAADEFGLGGFLRTVRSEDPNVSGLARGQDLTTLGLNLNSSEPLWPTFAGPFADVGARPLHPDFRLPECYTVDNTNRVRDKIPGFSDETLFWIFYTQPRDIIQELAASELTNRNWRFHKEHRMWLTKDPSRPEPIQIVPNEREQGSYIFFNQSMWDKVQVTDFILQYSHLAPTSSRPNGQ